MYSLRTQRGQPNPRFLDAKLFNELVLTPYREAKFEPHAGLFLFEFQRHGMSTEEFCSRLNGFFGQLPKDFRYAVEIRMLVCSVLSTTKFWRPTTWLTSTITGRICPRSLNNTSASPALRHPSRY